MSYASNVKIACLFDDTSFSNEIDMSQLSETGAHTLESGWDNLAIRMNENSYLSTTSSLGITDAFTISFRIKPVNEGMGNSGSGLVGLRMALLSKADLTYASETTSASNAQFIVSEITQSDGTNKMEIQIFGSTNATVTTDAYDTGVWHHFWISYNGSDVLVWMDTATLGTAVSGTVPGSLSVSTAELAINYATTGSQYETIRNTGLLDELLITNTAISDLDTIVLSYNHGIEHAFDSDYENISETYQGFVFDDPQTIQVNSVYDSGSELFVGRSDGSILRGSRSIWRLRRSFSDSADADLVALDLGEADEDTYTLEDGVLTIRSGIVRA